ncbi:MAG: deoxyribonuclease V [Bacteroidota bacterium]
MALPTHPWNVTPKEAIAIQKELRDQVRLTPLEREVRYIAGVDLSYTIGADNLFAAFVILDAESLEVIARVGVEDNMPFPYIPGLLSFREIPALMKAWEQIPIQPDLIMADGHGIAHPRRVGIASHLGLLTGVPALGCGKSLFVGKYEEPAPNKGSFSPLVDKEETIGYVLRTRDKVKPMFISPGHLITLEESRDWALKAVKKYRIPEPTRQAHLTVNALRRGEIPQGVWRRDP